MRALLASKIGESLRKELKQICSDDKRSIFKNKNLHAIESFKWSDLVFDLKCHAPLLYSLLYACTNKKKKQSTELAKKEEIAVAFCAGILLRCYSQRANLIQRVMSVLLYASHVPKQVRAITKYNYIIYTFVAI